MRRLAPLIYIALICSISACSDDKPLTPTENNALRELTVFTPSGTRTIFQNYDLYMATNTSEGASLEGLSINSATLVFTRSHRVTVMAWYPNQASLIASNTFPISSSVSIMFAGNPVYRYTNTLRIRAYDEDDAREVLHAEW